MVLHGLDDGDHRDRHQTSDARAVGTCRTIRRITL
jgi:hypothetical protein